MTEMGHDSAGQRAQRASAALLAWYRDMGADAALEETAIDWLARGDVRPGVDFKLPEISQPVSSAQARPPVIQPAHAQSAPRPRPAMQLVPADPQTPSRNFPTAAPDEATLAARESASAAQSLDDLQARLAGFDACALKATAKSLCVYRGAAIARVMIIGDAPGAEDDKRGQPFLGPAGELLDKMLAAIGLAPDAVHIANTVYWRPPGNRMPTAQELSVCRPFLERQVELVRPEIVVLLGGHAANRILGDPDGIMKLRGKWREVKIGTHSLRALATLHPRDLLKTPPSKKMAWRDLLVIDAALKGLKK